MSTRSLFFYRVYCTTDNKYVTIWSETAPTVCPENKDHLINQSITTIVDEMIQNQVSIKEENTPTGGHFKLDMFKIFAKKNAITTQIFEFDYPINVITARLITEDIHKGDVLCWAISPNTTVGALTSSYTASPTWISQNYVVNDLVWYHPENIHYPSIFKCIKNTVDNENPSDGNYWTKQKITLNVSPTVVAYVKIGFYINFADGLGNKRDIGYITAIDKLNNTITVNGAPDISFSDASPTYVQMTVMFMDHVELGPAMNYPVGGDKIGSSYVPANVKVYAAYNNKSLTDDKVLISYLEYLY